MKLIKKDIVIAFKKPGTLIVLFLFPLFYVLFFSYINNNMYKNLKIYVDKNINYIFKNSKTVKIKYLNQNIQIKIMYINKNEIYKKFENGIIGIGYLNDNGKNKFLVNKNDNKAVLVYNLILNYLSKTKLDYNTYVKENLNYNLLILALFFLLVLGSMQVSQSSLYDDINNKTIYIVKKVGFNNFSIIVGKIISSTIIIFIMFLIFLLFIAKFKLFTLSFNFIVKTMLTIILSSTLGVSIASLTKEKEIAGYLQYLFILPAMLYSLLSDSLSFKIRVLFFINPLTIANILLKHAFINDYSLNIVYISIVVILFFSFISAIFLKRTLISAYE